MTLFLERTRIDKYGAFGVLRDASRDIIAYTLEHAYPVGGDNGGTPLYLPKVPDGSYECIRGEHKLTHGVPFTTFEVTGVPGHTGILFHTGNTEQDSHGCIILGKLIDALKLYHSREAFGAFMRIVHDQDQFILEVKS